MYLKILSKIVDGIAYNILRRWPEYDCNLNRIDYTVKDKWAKVWGFFSLRLYLDSSGF